MQVIALISGGKDSLISILHCLANGHDVVALANLHPRNLPGNDQIEDLDSFMYQTIGHGIIPLYADALGIPLFRQAITGSAVHTGREYGLGRGDFGDGEGDDETEDLVPLLKRIKAQIPGADAVSTGAILSTYQRTRVESVAVRLGLTPLSYLWQYLYLPPYEQTSLLDDMRAVGQVAKIIKVASGGLDERFLWQNVADESVIVAMKRRMDMFGGGVGGALIGEGGEFETLAIDGPAPLWQKRIEIEGVEMVSADGGTSFVRLSNARLVDKNGGPDVTAASRLRRPPLLDVEFEQVHRELVTLDYNEPTNSAPQAKVQERTNCWVNFRVPEANYTHSRPGGNYIQLPSIMSQPYESVTHQMTHIVDQTLSRLHQLGLYPADIAHSTILLRNMSAFSAINPIYGSMFTKPNPPSRVTISCGELMPPGIDVVLSISVAAAKGNLVRQGLHVQSRSYWAPANIGPYSQAISIALSPSLANELRLVHIAGQIPLVSASMEMTTTDQMPAEGDDERQTSDCRGFIGQSVLSLQHLWRIGRAMNVVAWTGAVAFMSRCPNDALAVQRAHIVCDTWLSAHSMIRKNRLEAAQQMNDDTEGEDYDVWNVKNKVGQLSNSTTDAIDIRSPLPDYSKMATATTDSTPPIFAVQVEQLPRGADIEWCSTGIAEASSINYTSHNLSGYTQYICAALATVSPSFEFFHFAFNTVTGFEEFARSHASSCGIDSIATVYTTKPIPCVVWEHWTASLIPCYSIHAKLSDVIKSFEVLVVMKKSE